MLVLQWELTKKGHVVLSWCALPDDYYEGDYKTHIGDQKGVKEIVDEVHKRKIDLADEVLVVNIGGYYGDSTKSEIGYARACGKPVRFLVPERSGENG
jgi:nucleoside 2-deoxyribosyltransferase